MELLEGCTLRQELEQHTRLEVARALAVMRGVCTAVSAAHERGLIHRDLKPENIFLTRTGGEESAKILDFGLVKQLAGFGQDRESLATTAGVLVGTLRYMAPEQLHGGTPAESWDLWALSVVVYEMLVGAYPFAAPREIGDLMGPRGLSPVNLHLPDAPSEWQAFFEKSLSPDPTRRASSARELFSELHAAVAGLTSSAVG
jgi:serine/threonine-protein kinase